MSNRFKNITIQTLAALLLTTGLAAAECDYGVTWQGTCENNVLYFCDEGDIYYVECEQFGATCMYAGEQGYDCVISEGNSGDYDGGDYDGGDYDGGDYDGGDYDGGDYDGGDYDGGDMDGGDMDGGDMDGGDMDGGDSQPNTSTTGSAKHTKDTDHTDSGDWMKPSSSGDKSNNDTKRPATRELKKKSGKGPLKGLGDPIEIDAEDITNGGCVASKGPSKRGTDTLFVMGLTLLALVRRRMLGLSN